MPHEPTLLNLSQEVLLIIFVQIYISAKISFQKGVFLGENIYDDYDYFYRGKEWRRHHATNMTSWVPEEYIAPMLVCKYLRPIAWEAFLQNTLFLFPGQRMRWSTPMRQQSWWDMKLAKDPTDLARRMQSDLDFAAMLTSHWCFSKNILPNLRELIITDKIEIDILDVDNYNDLLCIYKLREQCLQKGVKFNAYLTLINHRSRGSKKYAQTIRLVVRDHGPVSIKEVKGTEKAFYDAFKQYFKDKFEQDLEPMECKRRRKFIKYFDDELEWEEGSWRQLPGL